MFEKENNRISTFYRVWNGGVRVSTLKTSPHTYVTRRAFREYNITNVRASWIPCVTGMRRSNDVIFVSWGNNKRQNRIIRRRGDGGPPSRGAIKFMVWVEHTTCAFSLRRIPKRCRAQTSPTRVGEHARVGTYVNTRSRGRAETRVTLFRAPSRDVQRQYFPTIWNNGLAVFGRPDQSVQRVQFLDGGGGATVIFSLPRKKKNVESRTRFRKLLFTSVPENNL